jgi:3-oxoacyl-[acyl-carrier protein] reductase
MGQLRRESRSAIFYYVIFPLAIFVSIAKRLCYKADVMPSTHSEKTESPWGLKRYQGKVALVTGGASGIGWGVALRLRAEGAHVWLADLGDRANTACAGEEMMSPLSIDVRDETAVITAVAAVIQRDAGIDALVNCAGVVLEGSAQATSLADWERVLAVNLTGTFLMTRHVLPHMIARRSGAIVNIGSDAALVGQRNQAAYCASKGGVAQFTRAAALDAAPYGVRVNCVCPCFVDTPMLSAWINASSNPEEARREAAATQPLGRIGSPAEIAGPVAFLCSEEASFATAVVLPVDGGATAQ